MTLPEPGSIADLHLGALYDFDASGRITAVREEGVATPRFHLVRTADANYWLLSPNLDDETSATLDASFGAEPVIADFEQSPPDAKRIEDVLAASRPPANAYRGPAFTFPDDLPPAPDAVLIEDATDARIGGEFAWLADEFDVVRPAAAVVVDGVIASLCCCARGDDRADEASLGTAEAYRGRGYAAQVTAAWAAAMRAEGRVPLYSTSWDNLASRAVARKLGLRMYGEDWHID